MSAENEFIDAMIDDIARNRLEIPTLPEVALRVRKLIDDPKVTTMQVSRVISTDPALSTRLIQVANSAMFTGMQAVDNVRAAVNRLGLGIVRNMVSCVVMKTLYQPKMSPAIRIQMQDLWKHSTRVAAFCHALAKQHPTLRQDEAMLAGLIHDVGTLPILMRAAKFPEIVKQPGLLQAVVQRLHRDIGKLILQAWHFPDALIDVVEHHEDLLYCNVGPVEYADLVLVANLHAHLGEENHPLGKADWSTVAAFTKLDLTPAQSVRVIKEAQAEIASVFQLLGGH